MTFGEIDRRYPWAFGVGVFAFMFAVVGGILWAVEANLSASRNAPSAVPIFTQGQFVTSVLSGQRGQVIRTNCWKAHIAPKCTYAVRFVGTQATTNTHTFSADEPITVQPFTVVWKMREYELRAE